MDKDILFSPLQLKNITLPGKIVRSSTELFCADADAHVFPYEYTVFEKLGEQPLGMILTSHTCISPEGRSNPWQNAIWDDAYLPETARIAQMGQKHGIPVVMQLGHGGMKAEGNNGGLPVYTPDTMTKVQIKGVVKAFGEAAARAKQAGMSGVMLHGAHLYLLSQFFYPKYNHRTDCYGGSAQNRFRIIAEALDAIKRVCGESYPVFLKINGDDEYNTGQYHQDLVEVLCSVEDRLEAAEISGWNSALNGVSQGPYFIENIRQLKEETGLSLIEVGGIRSANDMLACLKAGASAVSVSRPLLCEPDFVTKLRDQEDVVSKCRGCGFCYKPLDRNTRIRCVLAGK